MVQKKVYSREERWHENYEALKAYVTEHHQMPDKKKLEHRNLLNWWKYNKKCVKNDKLDTDKVKLLQKLSDMRKVKVIRFLS